MKLSFVLPRLALSVLLVTQFGILGAATKPTASSDEGVAVDSALNAHSAAVKETPAQRDARMAWWREAKFGMFIHWGVYSVPAGKYGQSTGHGEWIMNSAKISSAEYRGYAQQFNPIKYDPALWAKIAKDAGIRYMVITAKHHDGFALFPSAASSWNVAEATPYKKDLLDPLVKAVRSEGLRMGFYYSQAQDWNNPGGAKKGFKDGEGWDDAQKGSFDAYLKNVAQPQVRELLTRYPIDILWWDTPMDMTPERAAPIAALTALRPGLIMNNRLGGGYAGDTDTPEGYVPVTARAGDWETCMTLNNHWGYNAADQNWKSTAELIQKLATICSKGGNFLLNVGPNAEGEFPPACVERLLAIGKWLGVNGDSIYGSHAGPFSYLPWGVATRKGEKLYLHVFNWPENGKLSVPLKSPVGGATLLSGNKKLTVTSQPERVVIDLPGAAPDPIDSVVVLELKGEPVTPPIPSAGATAVASACMPGNEAANALDGTAAKRWRAPADVKSAWLEVDLGSPKAVGAVGLEEPDVWPRMKQSYLMEAFVNGAWAKVIDGKTNGHGLIKAFQGVTAQKFRFTMSSEKDSPGIAEVQLYGADL